MEHKDPYVILLDCFHRDEKAETVAKGTVMRCTQCGLEGEVIQVIEPFWQYRVYCQQCPYARYTGKAASLAYTIRNKHRIATGHEMKLEKVTERERIR